MRSRFEFVYVQLEVQCRNVINFSKKTKFIEIVSYLLSKKIFSAK